MSLEEVMPQLRLKLKESIKETEFLAEMVGKRAESLWSGML